MTNSELARIAEWAFSKNQMNSDADLLLLSFKIFGHLNGDRAVLSHAQVARGLGAIFTDLKTISRKLKYGGRSPDAILRQRALALQSWIENGQFSQLAA